MVQPNPTRPRGRDYVCALESAALTDEDPTPPEIVLPEGVDVHGYYDDADQLVGVKAIRYHPTGFDDQNQLTFDTEIVHQCGQVPADG